MEYILIKKINKNKTMNKKYYYLTPIKTTGEKIFNIFYLLSPVIAILIYILNN